MRREKRKERKEHTRFIKELIIKIKNTEYYLSENGFKWDLIFYTGRVKKSLVNKLVKVFNTRNTELKKRWS